MLHQLMMMAIDPQSTRSADPTALALGYMGYYGFTYLKTPPNVTVEVRQVSPVTAGFLVEFEARKQHRRRRGCER